MAKTSPGSLSTPLPFQSQNTETTSEVLYHCETVTDTVGVDPTVTAVTVRSAVPLRNGHRHGRCRSHRHGGTDAGEVRVATGSAARRVVDGVDRDVADVLDAGAAAGTTGCAIRLREAGHRQGD